VIVEVARSFQLEEGSMRIHNTMPEDFLLLLSDAVAMERVYNGGRAFHGPRFSLQFKKWSRFIHAEGTSFLSLVDVEIGGILVHAWECSTTEQLLRDSCWVQEVRPETLAKQDFSPFQLRAWSWALDHIHQRMALVVPEPQLPGAGASSAKQALSYLVQITTIPVASPSMVEGPPPPPADDNQHHDRRRGRRDSRSPGCSRSR
jgi:hypothetical protein